MEHFFVRSCAPVVLTRPRCWCSLQASLLLTPSRLRSIRSPPACDRAGAAHCAPEHVQRDACLRVCCRMPRRTSFGLMRERTEGAAVGVHETRPRPKFSSSAEPDMRTAWRPEIFEILEVSRISEPNCGPQDGSGDVPIRPLVGTFVPQQGWARATMSWSKIELLVSCRRIASSYEALHQACNSREGGLTSDARGSLSSTMECCSPRAFCLQTGLATYCETFSYLRSWYHGARTVKPCCLQRRLNMHAP